MHRILKVQRKFQTQVNYYDVLGVPRNAKLSDIRYAFKQKLHNSNFSLSSQYPDNQNKQQINELFKAFGILSLEKERLNYDSKLDLPQTQNTTLDQLKDQEYADFIQRKKQKQRKELNFNQFDRYNGGYPNPLSLFRGKSIRKPGQFRDVQLEQIFFEDQSIIDFKVNKADAEEFSIYQKFDQYAYEQPKNWMKLEVNHKAGNIRYYKTLIFLLSVIGIGLLGSLFQNPEKKRQKYLKNIKRKIDKQIKTKIE